VRRCNALSVNTTRRSAKNLGHLFDLPAIVAHVREVSYDNSTNRGGREPGDVRTKVLKKEIRELESLFSHIHQLPQLETINLTFVRDYDIRSVSHNKGRLVLQASIVRALAASFGVRINPKLTFLSLHNLRTWDLSPLESPPFQTFFATLQRLQLSVLFDTTPEPTTFFSRWSHFWKTLSPYIILSPTQNTLTEFTLHSDYLVDPSFYLPFDKLHFPRLCALSLRNLIFGPLTCIEPLILRHAATLTRLELFSCLLSIPGGLFLPLSLSLTNPRNKVSSIVPGGWHRMWDCFGAELTSLVTLHVACSGTPAWVILADDYNPADVAALRRFDAIVAARSEDVGRES